MNEQRYVLGLDLGVTSIGWGMLALDGKDIPSGIIDHGVVLFRALDNDKVQLYNQVRRESRGARRVIRRRQERLRRIRNIILKEFKISEKEYNLLFNGNGIIQDNNCIDLKIKGLKEELNNEQLIRILVHYAKNRGFKSNRKVESDSEKGKMKVAIGTVQAIMKRDDCTVSQALRTYQNEEGYDIIHNTDDNYRYGFERKDVEEEINLVLDKQIEFGKLSNEFKEEYLKIWRSQRDFSEGPAEGSIYKIEWDKVFGKCKFTYERRASRACPSFEFFTLIQKLQNIRYFYIDKNGTRITDKRTTLKLDKEDIDSLFALSKNKDLTYKIVRDLILDKNEDKTFGVEFVDMPSLSKDDFNKLVKDYKTKYEIKERLNDFQYAEIMKQAKEKAFDNYIFVLRSYKEFKKQLKKIAPDKIEDIDFLDAAATVLAYAKTDKAIDKTIKKHYDGFFSDEEKEMVKQLNIKIKGTGSLSLSLYKDLITYMLDGMTYDEAMREKEFDHSLFNKRKEFNNGFPTIDEIEEKYETKITQPNVKHTLVYLRKLYNKIVEKYGKPTYVHVELARDIRSTFSERNSIRAEQLKNQTENLNAKALLAQTLGLKDIGHRKSRSFSAEDILKFRLYNEQNGLCVYTGESIDLKSLIQGNDYQVDHILPFSRTFDDSYNNKVLVITKANQDKKNRTPYEWFGHDKERWNEFSRRINGNFKISEQKKNNLLFDEEVTFDEFSARSLHATSYVSKLTLNIFKDLLNTDNEFDHVRAFKGAATSFLRKYYRLNRYTHSYESKNYLSSDIPYYFDLKSFKIEQNKGVLQINAKDQFNRTIEYKLSIVQNKDGSFKNNEDQEMFMEMKHNADGIFATFKEFEKININEITDYAIFEGREDSIVTRIVYDALNNIKSQMNNKNRNNHLHHVVDALLIASMTRSMQLKITNLNKELQRIKYRKNEDQYIIEETGEVIDITTYENMLKEYGVNIAEKNPVYRISQPYDHFTDELVLRVFERDEETLNLKLKELFNRDFNVKVKYPSFQVDKRVSGALHEETIYGRKKENNVEVNTLRKSVKNFTKKDLDSIYDGDKGQKIIKEAISEWIDNNKSTPYPIHPSSHLPIKKVKTKDANVDKMIKVSENNIQKGYACVAEVARIQVYTKEGDNKLYFVQISTEKYLKRKKGKLDFNVIIWWGRSSNNKIINYSQLDKEGYKLLIEMYPGQYIHVFKKDGTNSIAKVVGFTSGMLEIGSVIGDQLDLIKNGISNIVTPQIRLTVSNFKTIKPVSVDIMGNLCLIDN